MLFFLCELLIDSKNDPLITVKNLSLTAFLLLRREVLMSATYGELILQQIKPPVIRLLEEEVLLPPTGKGL